MRVTGEIVDLSQMQADIAEVVGRADPDLIVRHEDDPDEFPSREDQKEDGYRDGDILVAIRDRYLEAK
jgi:hypothetical protein